MRRVPILSAVVALVLASATAALAQESKPILVVSLASYEELVGDAQYVDKLANPDEQRGIWDMVGGLTEGLDKTKPAGLVIASDGLQVSAVGFVPVKDFDALLGLAALQGMQAEDAGGGVKQVGPAYLKEQDGYAFIAQSPENLQTLPDPAKVLGELSRKYDFGLTANIQNIPPLFKGMAVPLIKQGLEEGMERQEEESDAQFQMRKEMLRQQVKQIEQFLDECDQITFGMAVDQKTKKAYFEASTTAVRGSKMAEQLAEASEANTLFGALVLPDAPASYNVSSVLTDQAQIDQQLGLMESYRTALLDLIDKSEEVESDEEREMFKRWVGEGMDIFSATIEKGRIDMAVAMVNEGGGPFTVLSGMYIAQGKALDALAREVLKTAQQAEEAFPPVKFDADSHKGATIHSLTLPLPEDADEAARVAKVFGAKPMVHLAFGEESVWVAVGTDSLAALKGAMDNSGTPKKVPVTQANVSLIPILKMAAELDEEPFLLTMANALQAGSDRVRLTSNVIPNGLSYRFEIDEGVLRVIGMAAANSSEEEEEEEAGDNF